MYLLSPLGFFILEGGGDFEPDGELYGEGDKDNSLRCEIFRSLRPLWEGL